MNKTILYSFLFSCCIFLSACAGTHGKIEWFPFTVPQDSVEKIIAKIAGNDSIYFVPNDRNSYKDVYLKNSNFFKVFTYSFYGDSTIYWNDDKNQSCIALIYVKDSALFKNNDDLRFSEKKIAIRAFNEHFISLIRQRLRTAQ
jgi:hypothetical protein